MSQGQIAIVIKPDGRRVLHTSGFTGGACRRASANYSNAIGGEIVSDETTAEGCLPETPNSENELNQEIQ